MKRRLIFLVLGLALAGCSGTGSPIAVPSIYAGTWQGNYTGSAGDNGAMNLKVDTLGSITGTVTDGSTNSTGNTQGKVDNDGHLTLNITFPGGTGMIAGNVSIDTSGHLAGTDTETGMESQQVTFTLTRQ